MKVLTIALCAVLIGSLEIFAELPPKLTPARLEGAWIGHDRAAVNIVRIVFEAGGTGALTLDQGLDRVALPMRWDRTETGLICNFPSAGEATMQIRVLEASSALLRVQLVESRRKRTFDLFREDRFLKRLERMRAEHKETSSTTRSRRARLDRALADGSDSVNTEDLRQNTAAAADAAAEIASRHMEEAGWEEMKIDSVEFLTNHWSVRLSSVPPVFGSHATVKISTNRTILGVVRGR